MAVGAHCESSAFKTSGCSKHLSMSGYVGGRQAETGGGKGGHTWWEAGWRDMGRHRASSDFHTTPTTPAHRRTLLLQAGRIETSLKTSSSLAAMPHWLRPHMPFLGRGASMGYVAGDMPLRYSPHAPACCAARAPSLLPIPPAAQLRHGLLHLPREEEEADWGRTI